MDVDTPTKFGHRYKPKIERERERGRRKRKNSHGINRFSYWKKKKMKEMREK